MELAKVRKLVITPDALKYAKIIASPIQNKAQRKRAFASIVALDAFADYMLTQGIEVNIAKNLFKIAPINEELEISDVYYNNWKLDVRIMTDDKMVSVPKCHYEYDIPADFYVAIKVDKELQNAEFIGFIQGTKIDKSNFEINNQYFCVPTEKLDTLDNLISCLKNEKLIQIDDEEEHEILKSSILAYLDGDLDFKTKKKVVKHLANCAQCRADFVEFYDFESIVKHSSQFPSVFEDHTLDFIGCTAVEKPEYQGKEELIDIRGNGEDESEILDELFDLESVKNNSSQNNIVVAPVPAITPVAAAVPPVTPVKLGAPDISIDDLFEDNELSNSNEENQEQNQEQDDSQNVVDGSELDVLNTDDVDDFLSSFDSDASDDNILSNDNIDGLVDELQDESQDESQEVALVEDNSQDLLDDVADSLDELADVSLNDDSTNSDSEELDINVNSDNNEMFSFEEFDDKKNDDELDFSDSVDDELSFDDETDEPAAKPVDTISQNEDSEIDDFAGMKPIDVDDEFSNIEISSDIDLNLDNDVSDASEDVDDEFKSQNIVLNLETEGLDDISEDDFENLEFDSDDSENDAQNSSESLDDVGFGNIEFTNLEEEPTDNSNNNEGNSLAEEKLINDGSDSSSDSALKEQYQNMFMPMDTSDAIKPEYETPEILPNQGVGVTSSENNTESVNTINNSDSDTSSEFDEIDELPELLDELSDTDESQEISALYSEPVAEAPVNNESGGAEMMAQMNNEGINKKKMILISSCLAGVLILAGAVGFGIISKNNKEKAELANQEIFNNVPSSYPMDDSAPQDPSQPPSQSSATNPDDLARGASEGVAGPKDMNRSMTNVFNENPSSVTVTKVLWEVSPAIAKNNTFSSYLQQAGKTIQTNLKMDLVNATEFAYNQKVVVRILLSKDNKIKNLTVLNSSGSQQIDDIVLQSIKGTLPYVNVPQFTKADEQRAFEETKTNMVNKDNLYDLKLVINF